MKKRSIVISILIFFVLIGVIASRPREDDPVFKNLKVISKKVTNDEMDEIMDRITSDLGVNCIFCHEADRLGKDPTINFVSDKLENKRIARDMMRMTMKLNSKYFNSPTNSTMQIKGKIWCKTCHAGKPIPLLPFSKQQ
jgi:Photosynthetic reaction centre cytochrome C subunit